MNKVIRFIIVSCCVFSFTTTTLQAASFGNFDPRSLAMGGTGVSSSSSANAAYYNPAMLSVVEHDDDFSLTAPIVGIRAFDPDDLLDSLEAYQDGSYETTFDNSLTTFNNNKTTGTLSDVSVSTTQLLNGLNTLSNKGLDVEAHVGLNLAIPSKTLGIALHANARGMAGIIIDITAADTALITQYINDIDELTANGTAPASSAWSGGNIATGSFIEDPALTSTAHVYGAAITEGGLSLSSEFDFLGGIAIGITPKVVQVSTFDYVAGVETTNTDSEANKRDYSDTNLDVGIAKRLGESWKVGFVAKNIMSKEYKTALNNIVEIKPQTRAGISHHTNWTTIAIDLDLSENTSIGLTGQKTRFAAFGMELDLSLVQVRAGYRHNLSAEGNEEAGILSAGVGLYLLGLHVDAGVAGNDDELEAAVQLGFQF